MKIFIIAGEESGDLRAADLVEALMKDTRAEFIACGGGHLRAAGCRIVQDISQMSVVGFTEVLAHLPRLLRIREELKRSVLRESPDLVIAVDYPGFNIPFLSWAHAKGFRTCYYILPQIWAWGMDRKERILGSSDILLSILPFEQAIYGEKCHYIGHPVVKKIKTFRSDHPERVVEKDMIGLFPGSRLNELKKNLPVMMKTAELLKGFRFVMNIPSALLPAAREIVSSQGFDCRIETGKYYETADRCVFAMISSGTATLEAALLGIPFVIIYKVSLMSYIIGRTVSRIEHIGLPNIVLGREAYREFIQSAAEPDAIRAHIMEQIKSLEGYGNASETLAGMLGQEDYAVNASKHLRNILEAKDV